MATLAENLSVAMQLHKSGEFIKAEPLYRQILEHIPDQPDTLNLLGVLCGQTNRSSEAQQLLQKSIRANPKNSSAHFNLGNVLKNNGKYKTAVKCFRTAIELEPKYISAYMNLAATFVELEKIQQAIDSYRILLEIAPNRLDAAHSLAQILWKQGSKDESRAYLKMCIDQNPQADDAISFLAFTYFSDEEYQTALEFWQQASDVAPDNTDYHLNIRKMKELLEEVKRKSNVFVSASSASDFDCGELNAESLLESFIKTGDLDTALNEFCFILGENSNAVTELHHLGDLCRDRERYDLAEIAYRRALDIEPDSIPLLTNLCGTLNALGESAKAIELASRATELEPFSAQAWTNLASASLDCRELKHAIYAAEKALEIDNKLKSAHITLAACYRHVGQKEAVIQQLKTLVSLHTTDADVHTQLGHAHREFGHVDKAEDNYKKALEINPDFADAKVGRIKNLQFTGNTEQAALEIENVLSDHPHNTYVAATASEIYMKTNRLEEAIDILVTMAERPNEKINIRRTIYFRLAEAYDKNSEFDKSFEWVKKANESINIVYNDDITKQAINRIKEVFTPDWIQKFQTAGITNESPIFIAGMPRSGTTLVEQILASHPDVEGVGELSLMAQGAKMLPMLLNSTLDYPDCIPQVNAEAVFALANELLERLKKEGGNEHRIAEKSPTNSLYLGLTAVLYPNAKLIYCQRNPIDTCLSCYYYDFTGHYPYTYSLADLGKYYNIHTELMQHWFDVLKDRIHIVRYEDVVENQEEQTRALLEFCDFTWNEDCLNFHQNKRKVLTASRDQVRKPLYSSSVNKYKHYEKHLNPLKNALDSKHLNYAS